MSETRGTLIDSHAHLDLDDFRGRIPEMIDRAVEAGVSHIITVGINYESALMAAGIAHTFDCVSATAGIHPNEVASGFDRFEDMARLLDKEDFVAIGETGLDFYRDHTPADDQKRAFREHVELALSRELPIIVHVRDAYDETLAILDSYDPTPRGVFHCFSGTRDFADEVIKRGFYVSFAGQVTFKNADELREVARAVPLDRLLVETDCPYLAPDPHRGKTNEPAFVRDTAEALAELRGETFDDLAAATAANTEKLFAL